MPNPNEESYADQQGRRAIVKDLLAAGQNIADARMNLIRAMQQLPAARSDLKLRIQKQLDVLYYDQDPNRTDCGREGQLFNPMNIIDKLNWPDKSIYVQPDELRVWYIQNAIGALLQQWDDGSMQFVHRSEFSKATKFTETEAIRWTELNLDHVGCKAVKL